MKQHELLLAHAFQQQQQGQHGQQQPEHGRPVTSIDEVADKPSRLTTDNDLLLDPAARQSAQLAPPFSISAPALPQEQHDAPVQTSARVSMEELLPQLVRRIAWAGDRRRGTGSVQLELGAGRHEGTTVTVHSDPQGRVRIELSASSSSSQRNSGPIEELRSRIDARLRKHGVDVESVITR